MLPAAPSSRDDAWAKASGGLTRGPASARRDEGCPLLRNQLAECLDLDPGSIGIEPVPLGGDFGGKGSPMDIPLCVELARLTGRPVKLVPRSTEDLTAAPGFVAG